MARSVDDVESSVFRDFSLNHRIMDKSVVARRLSYPKGFRIAAHSHDRAQFLYAASGTMAVRTPRRAWLIPPSRALWIPAHTQHEITTQGPLEMRTLYIDAAADIGCASECVALGVTPLLHELIIRLASLDPGDGSETAELLRRLLMAEIRQLPTCGLGLPLPQSADLLALCERVVAELAEGHSCTDAARDMQLSARTLYRRFLRETDITFARWKQQATLLEALRRLSAGQPVTTVALDLGYESPSAFSAMFRRALGRAPRAFLAGAPLV